MCSGRISSSCSICGTRRVTLVTNPVTSRMKKGPECDIGIINIDLSI
jgi:hypothetical protein